MESTESSHISAFSLSIHMPHPHTYSPHTIHLPRDSDHILRTDEPTLTHHHPPASMVCVRVHSWCCIFCEFAKLILTCTYHYSIIQNSSAVLNVPHEIWVFSVIVSFCLFPLLLSFRDSCRFTSHRSQRLCSFFVIFFFFSLILDNFS